MQLWSVLLLFFPYMPYYLFVYFLVNSAKTVIKYNKSFSLIYKRVFCDGYNYNFVVLSDIFPLKVLNSADNAQNLLVEKLF